MEDKFTNIYDKKKWGSRNGKGTSGTGSKLSYDTLWYIELLKKHIADTNSKKICDIGCGDWEFSKTIDWTGLEYTGMDCVKSVIESNIEKYSSSNVSFIHSDAGSIPKGYDFIILKDVIQHWDDKDIYEILPEILKHNKHVFLVNGYIFGRDRTKNDWSVRKLDPIYHYHPVDITKQPLKDIEMNVIDIKHRRCKEFILIN